MTLFEKLPDQIDRLANQIVTLGSQIRDEIQASENEILRMLREEIRAGDDETRRVLREEIRDGNVMIATALTEQIEESKRYTRVLFEEVQSRLTLIQEGLTGRKKRR